MSVTVRNFDKVIINIEKGIDRALSDLIVYLEDYARTNHIYQNRTGNLTSLTKVKTVKNLLQLSNSASYAKFVHDSPFNDNWLERTLEDNEGYILQVLNKRIGEAIG